MMPAAFVWDNLGRFIRGDITGDKTEALRKIMESCHPVLDSRERQIKNLLAVKTKEKLSEWASKALGSPIGQRLLVDEAFARDYPVAHTALRVTAPGAEPKPCRFNNSMCAVVREDARSLLLCNMQISHPKLDVRQCSGYSRWDILADVVRDPPHGTYAVITFREAPLVQPEELVLNISREVIRSNEWTIDRSRLLEAAEFARGVDLKELWRLAEKLDRVEIENIKGFPDNGSIDAFAEKIGVDRRRAEQILPHPKSVEWKLMERFVEHEQQENVA